MKRSDYLYAVQWIAMNDDAAETRPEVIALNMTVALLSDLSGIKSAAIGREVAKIREDIQRGPEQCHGN